MDRALLNNKFRILPVPSTHTLEGFQYGHNIITCVENDVMHVLFRGTRNNNESWRPKIARLETMLLSIARNHPYSESLWNHIFDYLGLTEEDMDFKDQMQRQMIEGSPATLAHRSPDLNQDDSIRGVRQRGFVRTGHGVPNSAGVESFLPCRCIVACSL
mmetsp:Transcript_13644/g.26085  ORF Transcript_13644/g.26085 Transcript_13644/m.26085 type:complete len:159 (+) Transcript_13644:294-770(+)